MKVMLYFLVFAGGVLNSLQSGSNSQLKKSLGNPWISGVVLYGVAFTVFLLIAAFLHDPMPTIQDSRTHRGGPISAAPAFNPVSFPDDVATYMSLKR